MCKHLFFSGSLSPGEHYHPLSICSYSHLSLTLFPSSNHSASQGIAWEREHSRFVRRPCVVDILGKMHPPTDFPDDNGVCIVPQQPISSSQSQTQATGTQLVRRCLDSLQCLKRGTFRSSESEGKNRQIPVSGCWGIFFETEVATHNSDYSQVTSMQLSETAARA